MTEILAQDPFGTWQFGYYVFAGSYALSDRLKEYFYERGRRA